MKHLIIISLSIIVGLPVFAEELVIFSSRKEFLLEPLVEAFQKETGIRVKYITGKEGPLIERIKTEKDNTKADILMTVDAGNLWAAKKENILSPMKDADFLKNVPSHFVDPDKQWVALSIRARSVFYNPKLVKASELSTYENLGNSKFKGKLCLRTSKKVYNQSLVAMMIQHHGEKKTQKIIESWVANLGAPVFTSDTKLLEAIDSGRCAIGIANTYYYGRLVNKNKDINVKVFWPNQDSTGVHVNISGAGIVKYSKNKKTALKFLEWSLEKTAQSILSGLNYEYPVVASTKIPELVSSWGAFKQDQTNLSVAGEKQAKAVKVMTKANYK